jgi:hypothetical protein
MITVAPGIGLEAGKLQGPPSFEGEQFRVLLPKVKA